MYYDFFLFTLGPQEYNIIGAMVIDSNGTECRSVSDDAYLSYIVVIVRGECTFVEKVRNAQNRGAVAVIMVDNVDGRLFVMQGLDASIVIPSVSLTMKDGEQLKKSLPSSNSILQLDNATQIVRDSAFDNGTLNNKLSHTSQGASVVLTQTMYRVCITIRNHCP